MRKGCLRLTKCVEFLGRPSMSFTKSKGKVDLKIASPVHFNSWSGMNACRTFCISIQVHCQEINSRHEVCLVPGLTDLIPSAPITRSATTEVESSKVTVTALASDTSTSTTRLPRCRMSDGSFFSRAFWRLARCMRVI